MNNEYTCWECGEDWGFFPEDYKGDYYLSPRVCPFCSMLKTQLFHDVYKEEGLVAAIKAVWKRI